MIGLLRDVYGLFREQVAERRKVVAIRRQAMEGTARTLYDLANVYEDTDLQPGGQLAEVTDQGAYGRERRQKVSYELWERNCHARNVVEQYVNHIVGPGFKVDYPNTRQKNLYDALNDQWGLTKMVGTPPVGMRLEELVRRVTRDGEAFVWRHPDGGIRFIDPLLVKTPDSLVSDESVDDGVQLRDEKDPESVVGYYVVGMSDMLTTGEVWHLRGECSDSSCTRGRPMLYYAREYLKKYERFMDARVQLAMFRSLILMFRKRVGGGPASTRAMHDAIKTGTVAALDGTGSLDYKTYPGVGRVIDHSDKIEYEFKSPQTGADEAAEDGRAIRLQGATYFGMPEYMYTGDAGNSSYASAAVAEAPGVKGMTRRQAWCGQAFASLFKWGDDRLAEDPTFSWPLMVSRDILKEAQAYNTANRAGAMSRRTWQEKVGLDPDQEKRRVDAEGGPLIEPGTAGRKPGNTVNDKKPDRGQPDGPKGDTNNAGTGSI